MSKYIITFYSHYDAVKAKRANSEGTLISVPRSLSSACGSAMEILLDDVNQIDFSFEAVYRVENDKYIEVLNG